MAIAGPDRFESPFEMHVETRGKATVLCLAGEFDLSVKKAFELGLSRLVSAKPKQVVVDMRKVTFIDSTGIRLILEAWNQSRRMGFDFAVVIGEGRVRSALAEMGLDRALPILEVMPNADSSSSQVSFLPPAHG